MRREITRLRTRISELKWFGHVKRRLVGNAIMRQRLGAKRVEENLGRLGNRFYKNTWST
ncbi:unnamed protein product [Malus baccata var. baccata]